MKKYEDIPPIAVNLTEAARLLGVSKPTVYRWVHLPGFPIVKIGGCTRVPVGPLKTWFEAQMQGGTLNYGNREN